MTKSQLISLTLSFMFCKIQSPGNEGRLSLKSYLKNNYLMVPFYLTKKIIFLHQKELLKRKLQTIMNKRNKIHPIINQLKKNRSMSIKSFSIMLRSLLWSLNLNSLRIVFNLGLIPLLNNRKFRKMKLLQTSSMFPIIP
jgi:hypothetical protein